MRTADRDDVDRATSSMPVQTMSRCAARQVQSKFGFGGGVRVDGSTGAGAAAMRGGRGGQHEQARRGESEETAHRLGSLSRAPVA